MSVEMKQKAGTNVTPERRPCAFVRFFLLRTVAWWRAVAFCDWRHANENYVGPGRYPLGRVFVIEAETIQSDIARHDPKHKTAVCSWC